MEELACYLPGNLALGLAEGAVAGEKAVRHFLPQPNPDLVPCRVRADGGAGMLPAGQSGTGCGGGRGPAGEKAVQRSSAQPQPDLKPCVCADGGAGVLPAAQPGAGCGRGCGRRTEDCPAFSPSAKP